MKRETEKINLLKAYNMLLYFAGSMIMKEPSDECINDFWTRGTVKNLPVKSSNPRFIKAASILRDSCREEDSCREKMISDYHRLFDDDGPQLVPVYESEYADNKNDGPPAKAAVGEFYKTYGWNPDQHYHVPYDHLGIELLFLTRLNDKFTNTDDEPCRRELGKEIVRFINLHILSWVPAWNKMMQQHAQSDCYKGIGHLVHACTEDIHSILS
ncbi:MAG: molecular chaperone TorD family protein [Bacteroidales bacterium]|nr:molecular chaperone TorD family protein [Bacteroidales bacterium]